MSHTPEPWVVGDHAELEGGRVGIFTQMRMAGQVQVAAVDGRGSFNLNKTQEANAARIVAAVNAVAGISTEELVRFGLGGLAKLCAGKHQNNA